MTYTIDLDWQKTPRIDSMGVETPWKTFSLAAAVTDASSTRGSAQLTAYEMQPVIWAKSVVDAAKARQVFIQNLTEHVLTGPNNTIVVPKRTTYLARGSWNNDQTSLNTNTDVTWTAINTIDGIQLVPINYMFGAEVTNTAVRQTATDVVKWVREEVLYHQLDYVDYTIASAVFTGATPMVNTTSGMMTLLGGDAYPGASAGTSTLAAGDILTTAMIAKARRLLMSDGGYYWNVAGGGTTWTKTSNTTNPWDPNEAGKPFVLMIAPEQEEALLTDSQFTNAAEYGGREALLNGEIGKYLGVKIVSSSRVPATASGGTIDVESAATDQTFNTNCHQIFMAKAQTCGAIAWGQKPRLYVFDWPSGMKKRIAMEFAVDAKTVHSDAIVRMIVADE